MSTNFSADVPKEEVVNVKKFFIKGRKNVDVSLEASLRFKNVMIFSDVNVNVSSHNAYSVKVRVGGKMPFDGTILMSFSKVEANDTLVLNVSLDKGSITGCSSKELTADIFLPNKLLDDLSVSTNTGDILIGQNVLFVSRLRLSTSEGYLESYAPFKSSFIATSETGDCDLFVTAGKNINIDFETVSGNFLGVLNGVGTVKLTTSATTGLIRNRHVEKLGSSASINISSVSGDIRIH